MNVVELKEYIIDTPEYIETILEYIGLCNIKNYHTEYRCGIDEQSNPTGITVKKDNLFYVYRSSTKETKGDLINLIQEIKKCSFKEAVETICCALGLEVSLEKVERKLPFSGYYKQVQAYCGNTYMDLPTYPESILDQYWNVPNTRFQKDGISLYTQKVFDIRYDNISERIIVPWRNIDGEIIGAMGRHNSDDFETYGLAKWYPLIPFYKSQVLYGMFQNYKKIQEKRRIFIGESEKFSCQLHSIDIQLGVAVGSHSISNIQANIIKSCYPEQIVVCFDEGLEEYYIRQECEKLKYSNKFVDCKVGYIFDKDNKYLPKGSKASPSDFGKDTFVNLYRDYTVWT